MTRAPSHQDLIAGSGRAERSLIMWDYEDGVGIGAAVSSWLIQLHLGITALKPFTQPVVGSLSVP